MQVWPVAAKMPETAPLTASSRLQSSNTMLGDLPPSSSDTFLKDLGGQLVDARAGCRAAGEGDLGDLGMSDERLADDGAVAGDDIHHARRQAGFLDHELHELEQRGGGEFGGLDDDGAAGGQCGRQLPGGQHQRRVPRRDERAYADRLVQDVGEVVGPVDGHHCALNLIGEATVVVEPLGHVLGLRTHLGDELAVVAHLDLPQMIGVLFDQLGDAAHDLAARGRRHLRPRAGVEGAVGGFHGAVGVLLAAFGNQGPGLARVGVEALELLAGDPASTHLPSM